MNTATAAATSTALTIGVFAFMVVRRKHDRVLFGVMGALMVVSLWLAWVANP